MYSRILRFSLHGLAGATLLLAACGQPAQQPPAAGSQPTPAGQQPAAASGNVGASLTVATGMSHG